MCVSVSVLNGTMQQGCQGTDRAEYEEEQQLLLLVCQRKHICAQSIVGPWLTCGFSSAGGDIRPVYANCLSLTDYSCQWS